MKLYKIEGTKVPTTCDQPVVTNALWNAVIATLGNKARLVLSGHESKGAAVTFITLFTHPNAGLGGKLAANLNLLGIGEFTCVEVGEWFSHAYEESQRRGRAEPKASPASVKERVASKPIKKGEKAYGLRRKY